MKIEEGNFGDIIFVTIEELRQIDLPLNRRFELNVSWEGVNYEFLLYLTNVKRLICFGSGAMNLKETYNLPLYKRHSWYKHFKESTLYYNDPTLYLPPNSDTFPDKDISIGWGVGTENCWYLEKIGEIIQIIANKINVPVNDLLFFSSSGGGFMSIVLATLIKGSFAIANNPQIFIENFDYRDKANKMLDTCFPGLDKEIILKKYKHRIDCIELFKKENYVPPVRCIFNIHSAKDVHTQVIPAIKALEEIDINNPFSIEFYSEEGNHNGVISKKDSINLLKNHYITRDQLIKKETEK